MRYCLFLYHQSLWRYKWLCPKMLILLSKNGRFWIKSLIRVFICICPRHCERNSCHNVKTFLLSSGFPAQIVTHIWRAKAKICSTFAFEFFLKFWTFVGSIQSSFLFSFQKYKFFWNRTKIDVFTMFFPWNYFLCGRIPSFLENGKQNVKVLWE